jgi:hypothetical protein
MPGVSVPLVLRFFAVWVPLRDASIATIVTWFMAGGTIRPCRARSTSGSNYLTKR